MGVRAEGFQAICLLVVWARPTRSSATLHPVGTSGCWCASMKLPDHKIVAIIGGFAQGTSVKAVAARAGVAVNTARAWRAKAAAGDLSYKYHRCGRKAAMTQETAALALELLKSGAFAGSKQVAEELHKLGHTGGMAPLHRTTVVRHAKAASRAKGKRLHCVRRRPQKRLPAVTIKLRLHFARIRGAHRFDWQRVAITDRCKFEFNWREAVRGNAWKEDDEQHVAARVNHGQTFNVYCMLTPAGMSQVHIVTGTTGFKSQYKNQKGQPSRNITKQEYRDVLKNTFLPQGTELFRRLNVTRWYLQQDNDPTHSVAQEELDAWNAAHPRCKVLLLHGWPPNSPDLSPIENVWAIVKQKVLAKGCKSFAEFKQAVVDELLGLDQEVIGNLYASLPKRMAALVKNKGDRIRY